MDIRSVCVFCGSSLGDDPAYAATARELGRLLADQGLRLVYGGASIGVMGAVADAALAAGGEVVGVIPAVLQRKEMTHGGLTECRLVGSMHERKATMAELADAFMALPGGLGTLEEVFEILTWATLGLHRKPCGFVDVKGYYAHLESFLDHVCASQFLRQEYRDIVLFASNPATMLDRMRAYQPPVVEKWLDLKTS